MVTSSNRLLDDVARLMTDAAGAAQGIRREAETVVKSQIERLLREMDMVTREDFEAVREMAIIAREENDKLAARMSALERRLAVLEAPSSAPQATKPAPAKARKPA
jgi:BMFP domain-containing protein YqiC